MDDQNNSKRDYNPNSFGEMLGRIDSATSDLLTNSTQSALDKMVFGSDKITNGKPDDIIGEIGPGIEPTIRGSMDNYYLRGGYTSAHYTETGYLGKAFQDTMDSSVQESDAKQGQNEVRKYMTMMGYDAMSKAAAESRVAHGIYSGNHYVSKKKFASDYIQDYSYSAKSGYGNVFDDFERNDRLVNDVLKKYNIDGNSADLLSSKKQLINGKKQNKVSALKEDLIQIYDTEMTRHMDSIKEKVEITDFSSITQELVKNTKDKVKKAEYEELLDLKNYVTLDSTTGKYFLDHDSEKDYRANSDYFKKWYVADKDISTLNTVGSKFEKMLDVDLYNGAEMEEVIAALSRKEQLNKVRGTQRQLKHKTHENRTKKVYVEELFGDSDAYSGYKTAQALYRGTRVTGTIGRAVTLGTTNAATSAIIGAQKGVQQVSKKTVELSDKVYQSTHLGEEVLEHRSLTNERIGRVDKKIYELNDKKSKVYQVTSGMADKGIIKYTVETAAGKVGGFARRTIEDHSEFGRKMFSKHDARKEARKEFKRRVAGTKNSIRQRVVNSAPMRIITAPFSFVSNVLTKINKMTTLAVIGLLIIIGCTFFLNVALGAVSAMPIATFEKEDDNGVPVDNIAQQTVDYLWERQKAYEECMTRGASTSMPDLKIDESWEITKASMYVRTTQGNVKVVKCEEDPNEYRTEHGYDFENYVGGKISYTVALDSQLAEIIYPDDIEPPEEGEEREDSQIMISGVYGYAGATGKRNPITNAGDYITLTDNNTNGTAARGINDDVSIEYVYRGSKLTTEYDPLTYRHLSSYKTSNDERGFYSIHQMYKAIISCATVATQNEEEDLEFYKAYCTQLYDSIMKRATVTLQVEVAPDFERTPPSYYFVDIYGNKHLETMSYAYVSKIKINVNLTDTGIADLINLDEATDDYIHEIGKNTDTYECQDKTSDEYVEWEGWKDPETGEWLDNTDWAVELFEMPDEDWREFCEVQFPGATAGSLSENDISYIIDQIRENNGGQLSSGQEEFIRAALGCVGRFYYKYAGKVYDMDNPPAGLDCSGFVSYACALGGVDSELTNRNAQGFINAYNNSRSFNGNFSSLKPGSIIVRNSAAGGKTTSTNHVVIYIGKFQFTGDAAPRDYCVECTNSTDIKGRKISGVQLSSESRMSSIQSYGYVTCPF